MSDLIRREDVIQEFIKTCSIEHVDINDVAIFYETIMKIINSIPSTKPEQKKGEWIDEKINSYTSRTYCSECGSSAPCVYKSDDYYGNHAHGETAKTKFCPSCGAEMRDKDE